MSTAPTNGKAAKLTKKDFESNQDVRWCPGCGDYAILATVQRVLAQAGVDRTNTAFISGIGCSSRFPYYMNTYGFHTIHGRAPALASGLKIARPDLSVWVITGDGDALSIGGNHLLHALRRNVDLKILLFNNQIYGLTKGQYSPTSALGKVAASTPMGSVDYPLNPIAVALGANASFVARAADTDAKALAVVLEAAMNHRGSVFIELLQNCPVFNDGVWDALVDKTVKDDRQLLLEHGKPMVFGANRDRGLRMGKDFMPEVVKVGNGEGLVPESELLVHDEEGSAAYGFMLANLSHPAYPIPMGVLRRENKPTYDELANAQLKTAVDTKGVGDLQTLLSSGLTWTVGPDGKVVS